MKRVLVIFGGVSNENEISVITGTMAANVLKSGGDEVIPLYISNQGEMFTGEKLLDVLSYKDNGYKNCPSAIVGQKGLYLLNKRGKPKKFVRVDVALNCCHGGIGEGGGVSGLCALNNIPLASASIFESASFMDKYFTKLVLRSLGVKYVPYVYIKSESEAMKAKRLGYPMIIKPAKLGSSIGVTCVENDGELLAAVQVALTYGDGVIAEKYVENRREINCAAYFSDGKVLTSECEESITDKNFLTYDDKYAGGGKSVMPADIPEYFSTKIKSITGRVYSRLNMRGIVRFDFLLGGDKIYLSEINTVPGSLSYYLLSSGFKNFYPVLQAVLLQAIEDEKAAKSKKILTTGILNAIPQKTCKRGAK